MNHEKKNIIIKELYYWKDNKLLPETYCDFLLALYTEGDQEDEVLTTQKNQARKRITNGQFLLYSMLLVFLLGMLLVIYFTELSFLLQIALISFCLISSIVVTAYFVRKKALFQVPLSVTLIELLISSLIIVENVTTGDRLWIGLIIILNCLLWIILGRVYHVLYLLISGIVGLVILILTIIT
jgi:hypothetical protein